MLGVQGAVVVVRVRRRCLKYAIVIVGVRRRCLKLLQVMEDRRKQALAAGFGSDDHEIIRLTEFLEAATIQLEICQKTIREVNAVAEDNPGSHITRMCKLYFQNLHMDLYKEIKPLVKKLTTLLEKSKLKYKDVALQRLYAEVHKTFSEECSSGLEEKFRRFFSKEVDSSWEASSTKQVIDKDSSVVGQEVADKDNKLQVMEDRRKQALPIGCGSDDDDEIIRLTEFLEPATIQLGICQKAIREANAVAEDNPGSPMARMCILYFQNRHMDLYKEIKLLVEELTPLLEKSKLKYKDGALQRLYVEVHKTFSEECSSGQDDKLWRLFSKEVAYSSEASSTEQITGKKLTPLLGKSKLKNRNGAFQEFYSEVQKIFYAEHSSGEAKLRGYYSEKEANLLKASTEQATGKDSSVAGQEVTGKDNELMQVMEDRWKQAVANGSAGDDDKIMNWIELLESTTMRLEICQKGIRTANAIPEDTLASPMARRGKLYFQNEHMDLYKEIKPLVRKLTPLLENSKLKYKDGTLQKLYAEVHKTFSEGRFAEQEAKHRGYSLGEAVNTQEASSTEQVPAKDSLYARHKVTGEDSSAAAQKVTGEDSSAAAQEVTGEDSSAAAQEVTGEDSSAAAQEVTGEDSSAAAQEVTGENPSAAA